MVTRILIATLMVMLTMATAAARLGESPPRIVANRAVRISPPSRADGKRSFMDPPTHRIQTAVRSRGLSGLGTRANQAAPSLNIRGTLIAMTTGTAQLAAARAAATRAAPSRRISTVNSAAPANPKRYPINRILDPLETPRREGFILEGCMSGYAWFVARLSM